MYGTWYKAHVIPERLTVKMGNNGRQQPPNLQEYITAKNISELKVLDIETKTCNRASRNSHRCPLHRELLHGELGEGPSD